MARAKNLISSADLDPAPPEFNEGGFSAEDIQVVAPDRMEAKAKEEKFMNELVEIEIEPGDKANDPMFVQLGHNGITQMVKRGQVQAIKRKFLYSALMAKQVTFACDFRRGPNDTEINKLTPSVSSAYRTNLVNDPNPQGGPRWVKRVMAEASGIRA